MKRHTKIDSKTIISILTLLLLLNTTVFATNPTSQETPVKYSGLGTNTYELTVPSLMHPGDSGQVQLYGTWDSEKTVNVSVEDTLIMKNSIDNKEKTLNIEFNNISKAGDNTNPIEITENITVKNISNALFGEWTGTITYSIDFHEHTWNTVYTVDLEPTCTTNGSKSIHCLGCADTKDEVSIPAEHTWDTEYTIDTPSTCRLEGSQSIHCLKCTVTKDTKPVAKQEHAWNSTYTVDKQATCTVAGSKSIHCKNCTTTKETTTIAALGHDYEGANCTECGTRLAAGFYDADGNLLATWAESGITAEADYNNQNYKTTKTSPYYLLTNKYKTATTVVIPEGITRIGKYTFHSTKNLKNIYFPSTLTEIGYCSFEGSGLTSVTIPHSVTSWKEYAFRECQSLTSAVIEPGVTTIGYQAFYECNALASVKIPTSVTIIDKMAFYSCNKLKTIYYAGTEAQWNAITKRTEWNYLISPTVVYNSK